MTWTGATPTPGSLGQAANLDNNSGNETFDEEALTNYSKVHGFYEGNEAIEVEDEDSLTRTAEDLAIQKSVEPGTIAEKQLSEWTFNIETSEYRYVNDVRIEDTLPNGLCPLGNANYEMPIEPTEECEPSGPLPSAEYSSVQEQEDGTWKIFWNESSVPALEHMAPSSEITLTFPTETRTYYQKEFKNNLAKPVLTGDSWTNGVEIEGKNFARCVPNSPTCKLGEPHIPTTETEGKKVIDASSASQEAGGITIDKMVREDTGGAVPADCEGSLRSGHRGTAAALRARRQDLLATAGQLRRQPLRGHAGGHRLPAAEREILGGHGAESRTAEHGRIHDRRKRSRRRRARMDPG